MATSSETLSTLKDSISKEREAAVGKYDTMLANVGSLESTIEAEKKAYGEEVRKEALSKIDGMDGEGKIYTEADRQAMVDEHNAKLEEMKSEAANQTALNQKLQLDKQAALDKAKRMQDKYNGLLSKSRKAQADESAIEGSVFDGEEEIKDEEPTEMAGEDEVVNEETGEIEKRS